MAERLRGRLPWRDVHFVGAGGVGMAGLALIVSDCGVAVSGSDAADSANLRLLRQRDDRFHVGHEAGWVQAPDVVVASAAVPLDNPELAAAREKGLPILRRGAFLAELATHFPTVVSVAGSHGKTTTTAMLAWVLQAAGRRPGFLIGGEPTAGGVPATAGDGEILVTEVDESDASQSLMRSTHAIVTNVDDDHCWSVGGVGALRDCFRTFANRADHLLAWDSPVTRELFGGHPRATFMADADLPAEPRLMVPGRHNRIDAALAVRLAAELGVEPAAGWAAMSRFAGVQRRLTLRYEGAGVRVIEDYAHHPAEVRASLSALRESWPGCRLRVAFQPHRFERIARYAADFARELSAADEVVVTEPFNAWLQDTHLADPQAIVALVDGPPARYSAEPHGELAAKLAAEAREGDIIAVVGAGSITGLVAPLIEALRHRHPA